MPWVLIAFNFASTQAFTLKTRRVMVKDAIKFCPPELQSYLIKNLSSIKGGISFLDRNPQLHFKPTQLKGFYSQLVEGLKSSDANSGNTARKFGLIFCYVADIVNPYDAGRGKSCKAFQCTAEEKIIKYDGYQKIDSDNIDKRIEGLVNNYKSLYYYDKVTDRAKFENTYQNAVNEIVDYWLSAWKESGNKITKLCSVGKEISHVEPDHPFTGEFNNSYEASETSYEARETGIDDSAGIRRRNAEIDDLEFQLEQERRSRDIEQGQMEQEKWEMESKVSDLESKVQQMEHDDLLQRLEGYNR